MYFLLLEDDKHAKTGFDEDERETNNDNSDKHWHMLYRQREKKVYLKILSIILFQYN